jgi:hypothetical protein
MSQEDYPKARPGAEFFRTPDIPAQRQYEALRAYLLEGLSAAEGAPGACASSRPQSGAPKTPPNATLPVSE